MRWTGVLVRRDLGSGGWTLRADGQEFELVGEVPDSLEGADVVVEGRVVRGGSMLMTGARTLSVAKISRA